MVRPVRGSLSASRMPRCASFSAHVVERLGHEPVFPTDAGGCPERRRGRRPARARRPGRVAPRPRLCAAGTRRSRSSAPASIPISGRRAARPVAYLVKPFGLADLERALDRGRRERRRSGKPGSARLTTTSCSESSSRSAVSQSPASRRSGDTASILRLRARSYKTGRYFSSSHGVSWTRYSSHSCRLSLT